MKFIAETEHAHYRSFVRIFLILILVFSMSAYLIEGVLRSALGFNVDFCAYYSAAEVVKGRAQLYDRDTLYEVERENGLPVFENFFPYQYPPLFTLLILPLTFLKYAHAKLIWLFLNQLFLIGALLLVFGAMKNEISYSELVMALFLCFNFSPIFSNLNLGQVNIFVFFLISAAFYQFVKRRDAASGILLAIAAMVRITPLLFIVYFLYKRKFRVFLSAVSAFLFLLFISVAVFGINTHRILVTELLLPLTQVNLAHASNQSFAGFFFRLFDNAYVARSVASTVSIIFLALTFLFCKWKEDSNRENFRFKLEFSLMITVVLLITNVTWEHHLVWLLFPFIAAFFYLKDRQVLKNWILPSIFLAFSYACIALRFDYRDPRFSQGMLVLAMSPKFYGTLLLWCTVVCLLRASRKETGC